MAGSPKCQLNSKMYDFDKKAAILRLSTCTDINNERVEEILNLSSSQVESIINIMKNLGRVARENYSGSPCPADGEGGIWIQVYQGSGVVHILDELTQHCGQDTGKYVHGDLPGLGFLKQVDAVIGR